MAKSKVQNTTFRDRGMAIQDALRERRKQGLLYSQRWLCGRLIDSGFPNLKEPMLSNILSGFYTYGYAPDVLEKAEEIVLESME